MMAEIDFPDQILELSRIKEDKGSTGNETRQKANSQIGVKKGVRIDFKGSKNMIQMGENSSFQAGHIRFVGDGGKLLIGDNTRINGLYVLIEAGQQVSIGHNSLISYGVEFRTTDSHTIIDKDSGELLNTPQGISIGDRCWIGKEVMMMPGSNICNDTIVGARALVTKNFETTNVIIAGCPQK